MTAAIKRTLSTMKPVALGVLPFLAALLAIGGIILLVQALTDMNAGPMEIYEAYYKSVTSQGELSTRKLANVVEFWIPLTLVSMGLVVTFRAGLWNIGVEGQMVAGGLMATGAIFALPVSDPLVVIPVAILMAMIGGGVWALIAGFLKTRFGVNEIFSGVALNAIANQLILQLIAGPWRPAESDKAQYSRPIPEGALLPGIDAQFNVSLLALGITIFTIVAIIWATRRTRWGLQLKATGLNLTSARLLGVPVTRTALSAMFICGALAGIGGMHRIFFTYENVRAQFSGGIGFLGLLVVLLVNMRGGLVPVVALLFAVMLAGGTQLQFIQLDTSLTGVLQGMLVLLVLLFSGVRDRWLARKNGDTLSPIFSGETVQANQE